MIINILIYLALLTGVFAFNIFYYGWFSWFLLLVVIGIPVLSLVFSLPFMINTAVKGIAVFSKDKIKIGEDFYLGVCGKKHPVAFIPQMKINLKINNRFAKTNKKFSLVYGGKLDKPYFKKLNSFSRHCGIIEADAKYCKVYDLLGIFFIPIKIDCHLSCCVMPERKKPEKLFANEIFSVIGYKPKSGCGYSDSYDLRAYQSGDRLKNIHWKLSAKLDDVIVKDPTEPIFKQLITKAVFSDKPDENDDILARLNYMCRYILKINSVCYCSTDNLSASVINNTYELESYFSSMFCGDSYNRCAIDKNCIVYSVLPHSEEVGII